MPTFYSISQQARRGAIRRTCPLAVPKFLKRITTPLLAQPSRALLHLPGNGPIIVIGGGDCYLQIEHQRAFGDCGAKKNGALVGLILQIARVAYVTGEQFRCTAEALAGSTTESDGNVVSLGKLQ
jgi:hypothetical protein